MQTTLLRGQKVMVKGVRKKVPMFLPKGPRPSGGWPEDVITQSRKKQEDWIAERRSLQGQATTNGMKKIGRPLGGPKTRLDFLSEVHHLSRKGWTLESAKLLLDCIQNNMADESYGGYRWSSEKAAKATGMSASGCQFFYQELKKAMRENYTLEQYFRLGRPFRYGKKVLA